MFLWQQARKTPTLMCCIMRDKSTGCSLPSISAGSRPSAPYMNCTTSPIELRTVISYWEHRSSSDYNRQTQVLQRLQQTNTGPPTTTTDKHRSSSDYNRQTQVLQRLQQTNTGPPATTTDKHRSSSDYNRQTQVLQRLQQAQVSQLLQQTKHRSSNDYN